MAELSLSDDESDSDIKYAVVMTNISQLEQTSEEHESQIALIMICFWGISLFASLFLARLSASPFLRVCKSKRLSWKMTSHELRTL